MAAAETDGGQRLLGTNHTPFVQVPGAVTEETGLEQMAADKTKDEVKSPELVQKESQEIKTEEIKLEDQDVTVKNNSLTSETDETKTKEASFGGNLAVSSSHDLDDLMDIGTVDQEEQEAQIKEEDNKSDTDVSHSPHLSNTGSSSPATLVNGTKEKVKKSEPEDSSPSMVQVKDEPVDDEYDQALSSTAAVKEEPPSEKEGLQIGAVFSVPPTSEKPAPVEPSPLHMSCCNCRKSLVKGQTAFQRKGASAVFCSTTCLTATLPSSKGGSNRVCSQCQKLICRPQDVIFCPDGNGVMRDFCSQRCLNKFSSKKNSTSINVSPSTSSRPPVQTQALCSMCTRYCVSKHEITLNGTTHKICSDICFTHFRSMNKLTMAGCANCGTLFSSKPLLLILNEGNKTVCNQECLLKFKEKTKTNPACAMCRTTRPMSEMVDNTNSDDSVNLFCSSSCVMAYKVQTVSTSGARLNCDTCGKITVPSYHLAMSDTSIRNFCSLPCVMAFQEKFKKMPSVSNIFTKLPVGSNQATPLAPQPQSDSNSEATKLNCRQCDKKITMKPEVIELENKMVFVCGQDCAQEFKRVNYLVNLCDYCKVEKITKEAKKIGNKNCYFCSDGCKLLYRHDLTKSWGKHCQSCSYCNCVSKKLVTAHYGNTTEEFCSDECRSKYTMLFCHVAKCDLCHRKGKLKQSLSLLGDAKHFCDLNCLLRFCSSVTSTQGELVLKTVTPVIANVVSLADPPPAQPAASDKKRTTTVQTSKSKPTPQFPGPKVLKNKALLCKPIVQNKGIMCKTQTVDSEMQTDCSFPQLLVVPVPVPVYIPMPMGMYSQCTPQPVGLPLPLPVPMFLPVAMNNAERIVETIQQIKEKIPSDPFEAELILMAEMVAEDDEDKQKQKTDEKQTSKPDAAAPDDRTSNYSDDLDTDELATFLNNWQDSPDPGLRTPSRPFSHEKLNPVTDPGETFSEPQHLSPPPMDLEADLTIKTLERLFQMREEAAVRLPPPPPRHHRKAREKNKGRKAKKSKKGAEVVVETVLAQSSLNQKLKSEYGLDAWKRWVQWRGAQTNLQKPRLGSRPMELKEDVLQCTTAELSLGLTFFISELKRPNGEPYSPDSLFYLCLGIQQHLFNNGRVENIFMDRFYSKFSADFTKKLSGFKPIVTSSGYVHSRVEEEFLWDCKQLGAYSPIVLLNTLLFFCCKYFGFTTVEQHRQLSFAHVMRCTKTSSNNTKTTFLRFYPPVALTVNETESDGTPAKKRKTQEENKEEILEMVENSENPLHCPVRLYEFYLSKCSESVKQRTNMFYLHPERCCVPNSPLWFSSTPLDDDTMEAMLIRILATRELHPKLNNNVAEEPSDDKTYIPEEDESD